MFRGSLYSVAVVFIIVLAQKLTRRVLSAQWRYALWLILLARLILPAGTGPETNWSLWRLAAPERLVYWTASPIENDALGTTIPYTSMSRHTDAVVGDHGKSMQSGKNETASNTGVYFPRRITQALAAFWLAGVLVMIAAAAFVNLRLWNSVRGLNAATDSQLLQLFEECRCQMRVKTMARLVVTDRVENPFLFGFIRPRVLLPADIVRQASSDQLRCVLLHELAHLKRGDIITGCILTILQSLHWFNPVIWWAFYRMRFDREAACDAMVLSRMSDITRRHYGDALIGILERFNHPQHLNRSQHLPAIVAGIVDNKAQIKRRLIMIKKYKSSSRSEIIAFVALLAVLSIAFLTEPRSLPAQSDEQSVGDPNAIPGDELRITLRPDEQSVGDPNAIPGDEFRMTLRPPAPEPEDDTKQNDLNSNYRTTVAGHVPKPGLYAFRKPSTVLEILVRAGGPLEEADVENIVIARYIDGKEVIFPFNYRDVVQGNNMHQNILLEHRDYILVPKMSAVNR